MAVWKKIAACAGVLLASIAQAKPQTEEDVRLLLDACPKLKRVDPGLYPRRRDCQLFNRSLLRWVDSNWYRQLTHKYTNDEVDMLCEMDYSISNFSRDMDPAEGCVEGNNASEEVLGSQEQETEEAQQASSGSSVENPQAGTIRHHSMPGSISAGWTSNLRTQVPAEQMAYEEEEETEEEEESADPIPAIMGRSMFQDAVGGSRLTAEEHSYAPVYHTETINGVQYIDTSDEEEEGVDSNDDGVYLHGDILVSAEEHEELVEQDQEEHGDWFNISSDFFSAGSAFGKK